MGGCKPVRHNRTGTGQHDARGRIRAAERAQRTSVHGRKDKRSSARRNSGSEAWVKIGGLAVRRCVIADISISGSGWPTKAPIESHATLISDFFNDIDPTRTSACKALSVLPVAAVPQVPLVNQCATADPHEGGCSNEVIWKCLPDRMSAAGRRVALADINASSTAGGRRLANGRRDCICWHCRPILLRRWRQGVRLTR